MDPKPAERDERPAAEPPAEQRPAEGDAAMTGATGSLTPRSGDEPFVPAELREIADPSHHQPDDPAYRREAHPSASQAEGTLGDEPPSRPRPEGGASGDGDEWSDEAERF